MLWNLSKVFFEAFIDCPFELFQNNLNRDGNVGDVQDGYRARQGRQQGGDTYNLEISFPAIKYVFDTYYLLIDNRLTKTVYGVFLRTH